MPGAWKCIRGFVLDLDELDTDTIDLLGDGYEPDGFTNLRPGWSDELKIGFPTDGR